MKPRKSTSKTHKRRRILLAMDLKQAVERWVGIAQYAREAGWILEARLFDFRYFGQHNQYLKTARIDGILSIVKKADPELQEIVTQSGLPVVDLWQYHPALKLPRVILDHIACGRMAANHLMDLGLKNLLFYSHTIDSPAMNIRRDGFRDAALERGIRIEEICWDIQTPLEEGQTRGSWLGGQLKSLKHPLGVMSGNDFMAPDVFEAAELAGLRIPEDIAVIGSDNDPIVSELSAIPLTSVDVARTRVGYEAAALLDRMISGEKPPKDPILIPPSGVVIRQSTEMLAIDDPDIIKAVRYIQEHFRNPITVADVAASTFLSRRRLQDRFLEELGHGMNQEIARQRVKFSQKLLIETKHKIATIAQMSGFGSIHRMSKVYNRETGMTPQTYRQNHFPPLES